MGKSQTSGPRRIEPIDGGDADYQQLLAEITSAGGEILVRIAEASTVAVLAARVFAGYAGDMPRLSLLLGAALDAAQRTGDDAIGCAVCDAKTSPPQGWATVTAARPPSDTHPRIGLTVALCGACLGHDDIDVRVCRAVLPNGTLEQVAQSGPSIYDAAAGRA